MAALCAQLIMAALCIAHARAERECFRNNMHMPRGVDLVWMLVAMMLLAFVFNLVSS